MFQPCGHRIVVRRDTVEETTEGGIIIAATESAKKLEAASCQTGVVVAVGPQAWHAFRTLDENGKEHSGQPWAEPGDYVLYSKYSGRNIDDPFSPEERDLMILNDEDVLCIIRPDAQVIPESPVKDLV